MREREATSKHGSERMTHDLFSVLPRKSVEGR
jgi:hypothetical protein